MNREKYDVLMKKYGLPSFEEMDDELDLSSVDEDANIIRELVKRLFEKIDSYTQLFESLIQPDSRLSNMREAANLNVQEKALVNSLYNKGMLLARQAVEMNIDYNEEHAAEYMKKAFSEWNALKPDAKKVIGKMRDTWTRQAKIDDDAGYFG